MAATPGPDLRDIHLPADPSWWPPAPGWWIVAALLIAAIAISVWMFVRQWREARWRRRVVSELDRIAATHAAQPDPVRLATDVSQLLRRASLLVEPQAAALHGEEWLAYLDRSLNADGASTRFRSNTGRVLIDAPYRRARDVDAISVDAPALLALARDWLKRALPRRRGRV